DVVRAAMLAWWGGGPSGLSLNEVCRHTGLSKSSLYREYGGEDGLMAAALEAYRERVVLPLLDLLDDEAEPSAVVDRVLDYLGGARPLPAGCFFTQLRLSPDRLGEATAALLARLAEERRTAFARWSRGLAARGRLSPALVPDEAAAYLDAQLTLLLVRLGAEDDRDDVFRDARRALGVLFAA
ncbi:MAG: hypothetical protein AAGC67_21860, partial [Myxococcota bacterium]